MEKYEDCEGVLKRYPFALEENPSSMLLFARVQKAQDKVEAVDSYARWLSIVTGTPNVLGRYEYAQVLETAGLYARALEQYEEALKALTQDRADLKKSTLMFGEARVLLIADSENDKGIEGLTAAVAAGFADTEALEALHGDERISGVHREEIKRILDGIQSKTSLAAVEEETENTEENEEEGE